MRTVALREKDVTVLCEVFRRFPAVREVRVFGSRATGAARRASDLDLSISAPTATSSHWAELCEALEDAPLIYELNLVRPEQTANERLKEKIAREGVTIYARDTVD